MQFANRGNVLYQVSCQPEEATQVQHGWNMKNVWSRHAPHNIEPSRRTYQGDEVQ